MNGPKDEAEAAAWSVIKACRGQLRPGYLGRPSAADIPAFIGYARDLGHGPEVVELLAEALPGVEPYLLIAANPETEA